MKLRIENLNIFRISNRRTQALVERIFGYIPTRGLGKKSLRDVRVIEIRKTIGSDYFVGLKLSELEFKELTFDPDNDLKIP